MTMELSYPEVVTLQLVHYWRLKVTLRILEILAT